MSEDMSKTEADHQAILDAKAKGGGAVFKTYARLSGPGWLQSAITLGGGSLSSSLYLGVLGGFTLLWLQPIAMAMGIIMLSAIGYVVLSTGERPFQAICKHVNPVLGWGWAIATLMANMVWALPQFGLATGAVQQNLAPNLLGGENGKYIIVFCLLVATITITWLYDSGGWGIKLYEIILKVMVAMIVLCFFGVVVKMTFSEEGIAWGAVLKGFIPNLGTLVKPAAAYNEFLDAVSPEARAFWTAKILGDQRDVMIAAVATAVGINMTFLLGYSMLSKGWNKDFRGLMIFDLSTGMLVPFMLATSCVVIASATQFHTKPEAGFLGETNADGEVIVAPGGIVKGYNGLMTARLKTEISVEEFAALSDEEVAAKIEAMPDAEKVIAAMLVRRDALNLAASLEPLTGRLFSHWIFGLGVVGMGLSTITILMLISGFVICEMLGLPPKGWPHRLGCLAASVGALGPFIWADAKFWLAVPTSVFGMVLLPIAYISFFLLMNQKKLLGDELPKGGKLVVWNILMAMATAFATFGCLWSVWSKTGIVGIVGIALFLGLALTVHFMRNPEAESGAAS